MKINDTFHAIGSVEPSFVNLVTGDRECWSNRHNTLSYESASSMAAAFGGDPTYVPNRIGIIYGAGSDPRFLPVISRQQTWNDLKIELAEKNADIQVQPFSYSPSLSKVTRNINIDSNSAPANTSESSSGNTQVTEEGTAVTFHMHSDSVTKGAFGVYNSAAGSTSSTIFTTDTYIYQAVLLNKTGNNYKVLARVSLGENGVYYMKPENFEVAIDWTVKFF